MALAPNTYTDSIFPHLDLPDNFPNRNLLFEGNLKQIFEQNNCALCIIDLQRKFCDKTLKGTQETEDIIPGIVKLKNLFNQHKKPVYVVYMDMDERSIATAGGGLYGITANHEKDIIIAKDADSVFDASRWCQTEHIEESLSDKQIDTLFFAGIHFSVCFERSAIHAAARNINTFAVSDCTANGQTRGFVNTTYTIQNLVNNNVQFVLQKQIEQALQPNVSSKTSAINEQNQNLILA